MHPYEYQLVVRLRASKLRALALFSAQTLTMHIYYVTGVAGIDLHVF